MRILAIRGQNLASLAERFEIDFTAEPLAGTGLFAITGDTGAGKSTILDALCLALYGDYPRASIDRREKMRDPSGDDIQTSDPKNILRRGAADGFAEAEFTGADGRDYRVSWAVRRARGKATGKLQKRVDRKLERCDGAGVIATGIDEVVQGVVALSGFTFEEFRRSVLLAQGEFDAFLNADEGRRADLLEKITGTEIYSRISMRVFEAAANRQCEFDSLTLRRDAIGVLDDAARETMLAEHAEKSREAVASKAVCERLAAEIKTAGDMARARDSLALAESALAKAEAIWNGAREDHAHLGRLQAVAPLRPLAEAVADRIRQVQTADAALARLHADGSVAEMQHSETRDELALRQAAASKSDALVSNHEPEWQKAAALDQQVETARAEHIRAGTVGLEAFALADRLGRELAQTRARRRDAQTRQAQTLHELERRAGHARLSGGAARIAPMLETHAGLARRLSGGRKSLADVSRDASAAEARCEATDLRLATLRTESQSLAGQLAERRRALGAIDLAALAARDASLGRLGDILARSMEAAHGRDRALGGEAQARKDAVSAGRQRDAAVVQLTAAEGVRQQACAARAETVRMADLAEATLSAQATRLRAGLIGGEPCPVCGAPEHPFVENGSAASDLARGIRQRRDELDGAIAKATSEIVTAKGMLATADARHDHALSTASAEAGTAAVCVRKLVQLVPEADRAQAALGLASNPDDAPGSAFSRSAPPGSIPLKALQALAERVAAACRAVAEPRNKAELLRAECDDLQRRLDGLAAALQDDRDAVEAERGELATLRADGSRLTATCQALAERLAASLAELAPVLACAGLTAADLARDAGAARRRLETLAAEYTSLIGERDRLAKVTETLGLAKTEAQARHDAAVGASATATRATTDRARHLGRLEEERAGLLEGAPTAQHRRSLLDAAQHARSTQEDARTAFTAIELHLARLKTRQQSEAAAAARVAQSLATAVGAFADAVSGLGLDESAARRLLAVSEAERQALATRLEAMRFTLESARSTRATRQGDLDDLRARGVWLSAPEIEAVEQRLAHHDAAFEALRDRLAILRTDLARDEAARGKAAEIGAVIARQKEELGVWQDVDAAIGQRDGAKFRRFAQGLTLGHLVALANEQLRALNPRYALARGVVSDLALDIVDRDMGEEVRSPRSLSGGERFLVSLALALALSGLEGRHSFVDTLFIDEGFGSLDRETLDMAIDALECLQGQGRKVGVITHVPAMMERIGVQVRVEMRGGGRSIVRLRDGMQGSAASNASGRDARARSALP